MRLRRHRKVALSIVLLGALNLFPLSAPAQIEEAAVRVDGMV